MEQKQLDEEDSYFGEEFIDDDLLDEQPITEAPKVDEVAEEVSATPEVKDEPKKEAKVEEESKKEKKASSKKKTTKKAKKEEPAEEITITPVKEEPALEPMADPIDPWADEDEDNSSLFKEVSTWKALTGIAVILLVLSLFTQGFDFTGAAVASTEHAGSVIPMVEAEQRALEFVNNNLLQPPFLAELRESQELPSLYKVTLNVAGQEVDSYLTKDGELFFPQGFAVDEAAIDAAAEQVLAEPEVPQVQEPAVEEEVALDEAPVKEPATEEPAAEEATAEEVPPVEPAVEEVVPEAPAPEPVRLAMSARKWLFEPDAVTVAAGSEVMLTLNPQGLDFTFSIPDLGVEEDVSGSTTVQFTATAPGSYEFMCGSCEDFRGMTGMLVVE